MNYYKIEGMKCESCVEKIGNALKDAGYNDAQITLKPPALRLSSRLATKDELQNIISKAGDYKLVNESEISSGSHISNQVVENEEKLTPLFVILSYIIGAVVIRAFIADNFSFAVLMNNFMGGFFVVFSLFKFLNMSGFADAFATYDVIASRVRIYGLSYPFIELLLGLAYFTDFAPLMTNIVTLILMAIGSVGVFQALRTKRKFQCACLGTALKLPMTKVTLVEDVTMGVMALIMIFHQVQV